MEKLFETRFILWLSAAIVAAAHAAVLFAWPSDAKTPEVLLGGESKGVEVDLIASAIQHTSETTTPADVTPPFEPVDQPIHDPAPIAKSMPPPEEPNPSEEPENLLKAEAKTNPSEQRATPTPAVSKPNKSSRAPSEKRGTIASSISGSGSPTVISSQPDYAKKPTLIYPEQSRRAREEGTVIVRITLDSQGRPTQVVVTKGSGYPRLDRAALEGVRRCKIRNAKAGTLLEIPMRFILDD